MELNKQNLKKIIAIVFGAILFYCLLQNFGVILNVVGKVWKLVFPFILGGMIAFIINVPMRKVECLIAKPLKNHKSCARPLAYIITLLIILGVLAFSTFIIVPELANTLQLVAKQMQIAVEQVPKLVDSIADKWPQVEAIVSQWNIEWAGIVHKAATWLQTAATGLVNSGAGFIGGVINGVTRFVVGFVFSVYLLMQKEKLSGQIKALLYALFPTKVVERTIRILTLANHTFSNFLSGQCLEAVILGTMFFITMTIFQLPYAMLMGILIAITALIPIFGAFFGGATGVLLIVMVSPWKAIGFLVLFFVLQQLEGNLIYPKVVGTSVGLPSIWVFVAVIIGGDLMGIVGMLIFIPLSSVLYALMREWVYKKNGEDMRVRVSTTATSQAEHSEGDSKNRVGQQKQNKHKK